ncbi:Two-component hybrid sensor and regulator [Rhodovulum sp. PH10]|uniref:ATP-binding protein n=1 Tax=Rhodovulum sp. PH10 TaxID=1187851 RepID=UPI00027C22B4|nr:ATP-binding protein [Rhodovulum sp. PH10]EJW09311.1 Two-component hybrid sensor and regulator [Rhodovulum sp. PH10]
MAEPPAASRRRKRPPSGGTRRQRRGEDPAARAFERVVAALAHDIRTPLTGILAISELLAMSDLGERERAWVAALKSSAEHLTALTSLIVDGARAAEAGLVLRREPFDLARTAADAAASAAARAQAKGIAFSATIAADLPTVVIGDQVRLRGAIENLLDNAVKFTASGGVGLEVDHTAVEGGHRVTIAVTDSGIGMRPAEIRRLFRPFAQASERVAEKFGGAGLGLAFVRRLARAMGGDVTVTSVPGQGSTFALTVTLTGVSAGDAADEPETPAAEPMGDTTPLRVLCVEDNAHGRVVLETVLCELGHDVRFVGSGEEAVEMLKQDGSVDIVLMDVVLSGIDGFEATRRIRALPGAAGEVPVIGLSGRSGETDEAIARAAGMTAYLQKPVSPRMLAQALRAVPRRA